jgi:hypothetical protein
MTYTFKASVAATACWGVLPGTTNVESWNVGKQHGFVLSPEGSWTF